MNQTRPNPAATPGPSILWYDLETYGIDHRRTRIAQFACQRTGPDLVPTGPALTLHCQPAGDFLPEPEACLITGITPQLALQRGVPEPEFLRRILAEFSVPGTCVAGFNNLHFDDEVLRHAFWRNLLPPYAREFGEDRSRWDLIDPLRMARALRPGGMVWPQTPEGRPTVRLDQLAPANGIAHGDAHDAAADVAATIALAGRLRAAQPRLFDSLFAQRGTAASERLIEENQGRMLVHSSGRLGVEHLNTALVSPLLRHPVQRRVWIGVDLTRDPQPLFDLPVAELRRLLFTPRAELPGDAPRIPVKNLHANRCPALAHSAALRPEDAARLGIDLDACRGNLARLLADASLPGRLAELFAAGGGPAADDGDVELTLYGGGFTSDADRRLCEEVHRRPPGQWPALAGRFQDPRLDELLFRMRARNEPGSLDVDEVARWGEHCRARLSGAAGWLSCEDYLRRLDILLGERADRPRDLRILRDLADWGRSLCGA